MNAGPAVAQVLAERANERSRGLKIAAVATAVLLHSAIAVAVIALPRLRPEAEPLEYVAVQVMPAAALGRPEPATPAPRPPEPEPEPPEPDPEPAPPEPEPAPAEPDPEIPVLPDPEERATPPEARREPPPAPAPPRSAPERPEAPATGDPSTGRVGSPRGSATGTSQRLGAVLPGLDAQNFTYGYYIDQMLAQIERGWVRPPVQGIEATLHFRILRSGEITEIGVTRSSGSRSFDLAALRAVRNASPLPPLPSAYREPALSVNLIVR